MAEQASTWKGLPQPAQELSMDWNPHVFLQILPEGGGLGVTERGGVFPGAGVPICTSSLV